MSDEYPGATGPIDAWRDILHARQRALIIEANAIRKQLGMPPVCERGRPVDNNAPHRVELLAKST